MNNKKPEIPDFSAKIDLLFDCNFGGRPDISGPTTLAPLLPNSKTKQLGVEPPLVTQQQGKGRMTSHQIQAICKLFAIDPDRLMQDKKDVFKVYLTATLDARRTKIAAEPRETSESSRANAAASLAPSADAGDGSDEATQIPESAVAKTFDATSIDPATVGVSWEEHRPTGSQSTNTEKASDSRSREVESPHSADSSQNTQMPARESIRIQLIFLASAWGSKYGGINAFNMDFAKALGRHLGPDRVVCVCLDATSEEQKDAASANVCLLAVTPGEERQEFDPNYAHKVLSLLPQSGITTGPNTVWIGHDIHSGPIALELAKVSAQGRAAIIQHMSYRDYSSFRDGVGRNARMKQDKQERLFRNAHVVFGVGPLLRNRLAEVVHAYGRTAHMIVPGLAEDIRLSSAVPANFRAFIMGRLGPTDDRLKQGRLAVAALASAIGKAHDDPAWPDNLKHAEIVLYGINESGGAEERDLRHLAADKAARAVNLVALPFSADRSTLFSDLVRSDVALMLSWHEGFGLTGWEAIAGEVPLIASENSGLFQLVNESLGDAGLALFQHLTVRGNDPAEGEENFLEADMDAVRDRILRLAKDRQRAKANARRLCAMLREKNFTWADAARKFVAALLNPAGRYSSDIDSNPNSLSPDHRVESQSRAERQDDEFASLRSNLVKRAETLIAAVLSDSSGAQEALAEELVRKEPDLFSAGKKSPSALAEILVSMDLPELLEMAHDARIALLRKGDETAQRVIAQFICAILPAKHPPADIGNFQARDPAAPVLLACTHQTIAEIIVAGADRRPTLFALADNQRYWPGQGRIAQHDGRLEVGRDPDAEQFEQDVIDLVLKSLYSLIGSRWRDRYREELPAGWESLTEYLSTKQKQTFKDNVNLLVGQLAREQMRKLFLEFKAKDCTFTYYFLIETPTGLGETQLAKQAAALQRVRAEWFPSIVFLRLAEISDSNRGEMNAYEDLHDLIYPVGKSNP